MRTVTKISIVCLLLYSSIVSTSFGDVYLFQNGTSVGGQIYGGGEDAMTSEFEPDKVFGAGMWPLYIKSSNESYDREKTTLIKFGNLGYYLPDDLIVQSARLGLTSYVFMNSEMDLSVSEVLKPWNDALLSWNEDGLGNPWASGGALGTGANGAIAADRSVAVMDTVTVPSDTDPGDVIWLDMDKSVVQQWVRDNSSNNGMVFFSHGTAGIEFKTVGSLAAGGSYPSQRPQLEITGITASQCSDYWNNDAGYAKDLNQDCTVNLADLMIFVNDSWLSCNNPADASCSN